MRIAITPPLSFTQYSIRTPLLSQYSHTNLAGGADANRFMRGLTEASIEEYAVKRKVREKAMAVAKAQAALALEERLKQRGTVREKRLTDKANADAAAFGMVSSRKQFTPVDVAGNEKCLVCCCCLWCGGCCCCLFLFVSCLLTLLDNDDNNDHDHVIDYDDNGMWFVLFTSGGGGDDEVEQFTPLDSSQKMHHAQSVKKKATAQGQGLTPRLAPGFTPRLAPGSGLAPEPGAGFEPIPEHGKRSSMDELSKLGNALGQGLGR